MTDNSKSIAPREKRNEMLNKLGVSKNLSDRSESESEDEDMVWNFIKKF